MGKGKWVFVQTCFMLLEEALWPEVFVAYPKTYRFLKHKAEGASGFISSNCIVSGPCVVLKSWWLR